MTPLAPTTGSTMIAATVSGPSKRSWRSRSARARSVAAASAASPDQPSWYGCGDRNFTKPAPAPCSAPSRRQSPVACAAPAVAPW